MNDYDHIKEEIRMILDFMTGNVMYEKSPVSDYVKERGII